MAIQGFQTQVNQLPAPGVEGDFCTLNPIYDFPAGPGGLVAGPNGLLVGRFAWPEYNFLDPDNAPTVVNNYGAGLPYGLVGRRQTGIITVFLQEASMMIPPGLGVGINSSADMWVVNRGTTPAVRGMKAYAAFGSGNVSFAATGSPSGGGSAATSTVAAGTSSVTGSIAGNVLTVTAVGSGTVYPGTTISGTNVVTGTQIGAQLSGTTGGVGTYAVTIGDQTVASTTISGTYGLLTLGTVTGAPFAVGDVISGTGVVAGTAITYGITGAGGTGATMVVNNNTVVSSTTISVSAINIETGWYAQSTGNVNEIVKVSRLPGPYAGATG
jgi:hypothetical protein